MSSQPSTTKVFKFQDAVTKTVTLVDNAPNQRAGSTPNSNTVTRQPSRRGPRFDSDFKIPPLSHSTHKFAPNREPTFGVILICSPADHPPSCSLRNFTCVDCSSSSLRIFKVAALTYPTPCPSTLRIYEQWIILQRMQPVPVDSLRSAMAPAIGVW